MRENFNKAVWTIKIFNYRNKFNAEKHHVLKLSCKMLNMKITHFWLRKTNKKRTYLRRFSQRIVRRVQRRRRKEFAPVRRRSLSERVNRRFPFVVVEVRGLVCGESKRIFVWEKEKKIKQIEDCGVYRGNGWTRVRDRNVRGTTRWNSGFSFRTNCSQLQTSESIPVEEKVFEKYNAENSNAWHRPKNRGDDSVDFKINKICQVFTTLIIR